MDRFQYLLVMAACLAGTAPLERFGRGVYRQPGRLLITLAVVAVPFTIWDLIAIARHHWRFSPRYTTGWTIGSLPLEEAVFFVVIPLCALLTYGAVRAMLGSTGDRGDG
ncbi:MAG: lycopene cyclase domain-containing protein [Acidimicrobiales bacterium]